VIFEGTTRLGEALAIVVCFITDEWIIEHCLVKVQLLAKILTSKEIARELIQVLWSWIQQLACCNERQGFNL